MPRRIQGFGWIPDHPDHRDYRYTAPPPTLRSLPPWVDLRRACPPVYDQRSLGSCTANVVAAALQFDQVKQGRPFHFTPSRLFIYYNARSLEGTIEVDSGAMIRDAVKSVATWGACPEPMWGYDTAALRARPSLPCYQVAAWHKAVRYERVAQDLMQMKGCLASGYPFALGFTVYDSFLTPEVAATGHAPLPTTAEQVAGSHAVLAVGYDDAHRWFILRNSWGPRWGMQGYFTLPYSYLTQASLADDFWTVRWVQ
jgi:C1A family cysteine protease